MPDTTEPACECDPNGMPAMTDTDTLTYSQRMAESKSPRGAITDYLDELQSIIDTYRDLARQYSPHTDGYGTEHADYISAGVAIEAITDDIGVIAPDHAACDHCGVPFQACVGHKGQA